MSVVLTEASNGVGRVTLNRPEQMNAITIALGRELEAAFRELGTREDVSVIVVRGTGGNFSAGGDFREVERLRADGAAALVPLFEHFARACAVISQLPQPVVAVVEGVAMAGGFELLQAADIALVRDDAKLCDNHVNYGQVPGGGGSQRLPRLVGRQRALGHLLSGDRLNGPAAVALGLAHASYDAASFEEQVEAFIAKMASRRRDALTKIKRLVYDGLALPPEDGLALELRTVVDHISGEAGGAGVSSFAEKKA